MSATFAAAAGDDLSATLITCSYRGDLAACELLCESIDRFVPETIPHTLFAPESDMALFAPLASARRVIRSQESLLPRGFWKVPLPGPAWRRRLRLPRRDIFLTPCSPPVRGWIVQQIVKLAATAESDRAIVVHVDSDNAFVRPLKAGYFLRDGRVRFYRSPRMVSRDSHRVWHRVAGRLLGLEQSDYYGAEYIDQLVVWRRSVLRGTVDRIEAETGIDWRIALARTPHFAEYVLYGVFAEAVLGLETAGLFATDETLCHARWSDEFAGAEDIEAFVHGIRPGHLTCNLQSTIDISMDTRRAIFERVAAVAALQDAAGATSVG